jgi:hypothetical protein
MYVFVCVYVCECDLPCILCRRHRHPLFLNLRRPLPLALLQRLLPHKFLPQIRVHPLLRFRLVALPLVPFNFATDTMSFAQQCRFALHARPVVVHGDGRLEFSLLAFRNDCLAAGMVHSNRRVKVNPAHTPPALRTLHLRPRVLITLHAQCKHRLTHLRRLLQSSIATAEHRLLLHAPAHQRK